MNDIRAMPCECCYESSGRIYRYDPCPDDPYYMHDTGEPCPYCDGTGLELIEVAPIELSDLAP